MQDADGQRYCGKMIYAEIEAPHRFTAKDIFTDEDGSPSTDLPEACSRFEFSEVNGDSVLTCGSRYETKKERDSIIEMGVEAGLSQCFDRLDQYLTTLAK